MTLIPKKIHYCWFGRSELPKLARKCIKSWRRYNPEYEIIEWNEDNFDINSVLFIKQAYEARKYAFVSDYVRLYVLYNYGGIYMDTDVEVVKPLDCFLNYEAFSGLEDERSIAAGIMGCKSGHTLFKEFMDYYEDKSFINIDGSYNQTTIVKIITSICAEYKSEHDSSTRMIGGLMIFPKTYFYPLSYDDYSNNFSSNTYAIHHYAGSWLSREERQYLQDVKRLKKYMDKKIALKNHIPGRLAVIVLDIVWLLSGKVRQIIRAVQ